MNLYDYLKKKRNKLADEFAWIIFVSGFEVIAVVQV